jgi:hypothetical protein
MQPLPYRARVNEAATNAGSPSPFELPQDICMNEALPEKPRRIRGRTAAAAAAVLGATLLAYPGGTASAQTIDCAALGDDPGVINADDAFTAAAECGVEVRILERSGPYSNLYATPEGRVHLIATVDPTQDNREYGAFDPSLVPSYGRLLQAHTVSAFYLQYDDADQPLARTFNLVLDWTGTTPTPEYSGTTATYQGLATGLDLTVDVDASSAKLQFAIADLDAWNALATGLVAKKDSDYLDLRAENGMLTLDDSSSPIGTTDHTTPFIVRDVAGTTTPAHLSRADDGSLTVSVPEDALTEAAFPLTLSTQWAVNHSEVNTWGAVSSAAPEFALYRGEADLDQPYFEAVGESTDAIVGPYCDALADASCSTTATAATYWSFPWADLPGRAAPDHSYAFTFPVVSATFTIAAGDPGACLAPDLLLAEEYTAAATWDRRPGVTGAAAGGVCEDGSAVYDVTDVITDSWESIEWGPGPSVTFAMAEGETARFDGGSATLNAYFHVFGLDYFGPQDSTCNDSPETPTLFGRSVAYGGFYAEPWPGTPADETFSWTTSFIDAGSGETVLVTEPVPFTMATWPRHEQWIDDPGIPDGRYSLVHTITSSSGNLEYRADPCYIAIDTSAPEILDYSVESGQHYVGEPVSITVTVADEGFPDGVNTVQLGCAAGNFDPARDEVLLTDSATGTCEITPPTSDPWLSFWMWDGADNFGSLDTPGLQATHSRNDFNGDGNQDLMAVREYDGSLMYYAGNGDGTFKTGVSKGSGWGGVDVVMSGDLNGDGNADLLGRDNKTGILYRYPGNGAGGWGARVSIGPGWNAMGAFTASGDFNADGNIDLLAVKKSNGTLYLYPGTGNGAFGAASAVRSQLTSSWSGFDGITAAGDVDGDGYDDFLVHDDKTGTHHVYFNNGTGQFHLRAAVPASLDGTGSDRFSQIVGVGDVDGDNYEDLLAIDSRTGELELHALAANGSALHEGKVVGSGWGANRLPAAVRDGSYDYNGDSATDFVARRNSDGTTFLYPGNGSGTHGARISWGAALNGMTLIATAGDMNGDGFADVLARTSGGTLYLYPGTGSGALNTAGRITIGSGWNAMGTITGGHDYDSDGKADAIAVHASTGVLYLYPGKGDGTFGARKQIGTGWNGMREITAAGDLDHDGRADMIAARISDGCLYFYGGKGDGTFKPLVQIGCGWAGYDAVTAVGDFNRDGHADFLARRKSDGVLFLYPGNGAGGHGTRTQVGTGWNAMTIA